MATSDSAQLKFESARQAHPLAQMEDSGDHTIYTMAGIDVWSGYSGYSPSILPNGVASGRNMLTAGTANNTVDSAAFSAYSKGAKYTVAAATGHTITRPATGVAKINSITMDEDGAISVIAGTDGADGVNFSETRGSAGGPPVIPADSVEIGQVRVTSATDAPIVADEIFQVEGEHVERYDLPAWSTNNVGDGLDAESSAQKYAYCEFESALPEIHTDSAPKRVYAKVYEPIMTTAAKAQDHKAAETGHSSSSEEYYGGSVASPSESLGQGSFTALVSNNITDSLVRQKNNTITLQFFPDKNEPEYVLTQGKLGVNRSWNVGSQNAVACTLTSETASADFDG